MQQIDLSIADDIRYFEMWKIKYYENYTFFYDESNNCRKFWIKNADRKFNTNYDEDFVLGGVAFKGEIPELTLDDMITILHLQKNTTEIKFKSHFSEKSFLQCMKKKRMLEFLKWIRGEDLFIHYFNVNNLYYAVVELLDSITTPSELDEFGFEYFDMKGVLFETLKNEAEKLQEIMAQYKFPNIIKNDIAEFCNKIISIFPDRYSCTIKQKYIMGSLKRAAAKQELFFLENNKDYIMQENYLEFYIDPIRTYPNSMHYFDEEFNIQEKMVNYKFVRDDREVKNYLFMNSKDNIWIQISDVIAGIYGKLFKYVNEVEERVLLNEIKNYDPTQLESIYLLCVLRNTSNNENVGFLHSNTSRSIIEKLDRYLLTVEKLFLNV